MVSDDAAVLEDEHERAKIVDIVERIFSNHEQIGPLAPFHGPDLITDATGFRGVLGGGLKGLPRRSPAFHPQPEFQKRALTYRADVGTERHLDTSLERPAKPR